MLNNTKRSLEEIKERYGSAHLIIAKFGTDGEKVVCNQSMEDIPQLLATIESLKAITELAVKGLEESKIAIKCSSDYHLNTCTCTECNALGSIEFILSEIERLSQ